jgi:hypothetical protein
MRLIGNGASMSALATDLSMRLGSPVIDRTNMAGNYDFAVDISSDDIHPGAADPNSSTGPGVSLFDSIQKLGLKLKTQKVPLDVLVVDHAEKVPTANWPAMPGIPAALEKRSYVARCRRPGRPKQSPHLQTARERSPPSSVHIANSLTIQQIRCTK